MNATLSIYSSSFEQELDLLPHQTISLPPNIKGAILFINESTQKGAFLLTFAGLKTSGSIKPNEIKLVTYSSAQPGFLQNIGSVTLEVHIN